MGGERPEIIAPMGEVSDPMGRFRVKGSSILEGYEVLELDARAQSRVSRGFPRYPEVLNTKGKFPQMKRLLLIRPPSFTPKQPFPSSNEHCRRGKEEGKGRKGAVNFNGPSLLRCHSKGASSSITILGVIAHISTSDYSIAFSC